MTGFEQVSTATLEVVNKNVEKGDVDVEDGTVISGIALGSGDVTVGQSETKKKWPAETLREAAPTLAGQPLVIDHENDSQSVVGKVTKSGYKENVGVVYEGIIFDDELAQKIENGLLEVSIRGFHPDPAEMEKAEDGAAIIDKLVFSNLSIVPEGASPSNTLGVGHHADLEALDGNLFDGVAQLTEGKNGTAGEGDYVVWFSDEQDNNRFGKVITDYEDSDELEIIPEDDSETVDVPASDVEVWNSDGERASKHDDEPDDADVSSLDTRMEAAINNIVKSHNDMVDDEWRTVDFETARKIYIRAAEDYDKSFNVDEPTYAMARLNSFLSVLRGDNPEKVYREDFDLLPSEHDMAGEHSDGGDDGDSTAADGETEQSVRDVDVNTQKVYAGEIVGEISVPDEKREEFTSSAFSETFESIKKAQNRAKELGLSGYHIINLDGRKLYMPGDDHKEFLQSIRDEIVEEDKASRTEQSDGYMTDDTLGVYEKLCKDHNLEPGVLEPVAELDSIKELYTEFQDATNMTADEMRDWMEHPCSTKASVRPVKVQKRNLNLLSKPMEDWDEADAEDAGRAVSFIARMRAKENRPENPMEGPKGCPSKWAISLLNWGYNPFDELPEEPEANLAEHFPSYKGIDAEADWSSPDFEDFREPYNISEDTSWADLDDGMRSAIAEHFLYSESGWPAENFGDLKFPVVHPDGLLYLSALRSAKSMIPQADIPEDSMNRLREIVNDLAKREFGKDWTQGEPTEQSVDIPQDDLKLIQTEAHSISPRTNASLQMFKEVYRRGRDAYEQMPSDDIEGLSQSEFAMHRVEEFANMLESGLPSDGRYTEDNDLLPKNHPRSEPTNTEDLTTTSVAGFRGVELEQFPVVGTDSGVAEATLEQGDNDMTEETTEERIEELEAQVEELEARNDELLDEVEAVRGEYAAALAGDSPFSEDELMEKFTVEELRDKYDATEDAELAGGPAPETGGAGEAELSEADEETQEQVAQLESRIDNYEQMGWDAAKEQAEAELAELSN